MSTKQTGVPAYDNATHDEPLFVLRATDKLAAKAVLYWAQMAADAGVAVAKVASARAVAADMLEWQQIRGCKLPD